MGLRELKNGKSGREIRILDYIPVNMVFQKYENGYCINFKSCKRCLIIG